MAFQNKPRERGVRVSAEWLVFNALGPITLFPITLTTMHRWKSPRMGSSPPGLWAPAPIHLPQLDETCRSSRTSIRISMKLLEFSGLIVATDDPTGNPTIVIADGYSIWFGTIISGKSCVRRERDRGGGTGCGDSGPQPCLRGFREADHSARNYERRNDSHRGVFLDRARIGNSRRAAGDRPALFDFREFGGDQKHSGLLGGFRNACGDNPAVRSGGASVADGGGKTCGCYRRARQVGDEPPCGERELAATHNPPGLVRE